MKRSRIKPVGRRALREREDLTRAVQVARERADGRCERCKKFIGYFGGDPHHLLARSLGGPHTPENLAILCRPCHDAIEDHHAPDWRKWIRRSHP